MGAARTERVGGAGGQGRGCAGSVWTDAGVAVTVLAGGCGEERWAHAAADFPPSVGDSVAGDVADDGMTVTSEAAAAVVVDDAAAAAAVDAAADAEGARGVESAGMAGVAAVVVGPNHQETPLAGHPTVPRG